LLAWWTNREQSFRCYANETKGEMREIDREAEQSESGISDLGVIADLRAAGKRLGDSALTAAIRRVGWQAARDTQRCAVAEARVAQSAAQIDVLSRQRDEALARCLKWNTHGGSHFIETIQKTNNWLRITRPKSY
jgi:hypothetical protein